MAPPEIVFPLLCPVVEEKWAPGWITEKVMTKSGGTELDCMFITPSTPHNTIWIVSKYNPIAFQLEMYKITPECTIGKIKISLADSGNHTTSATISYEFTAIGEAGEPFMDEFTYDWYVRFMKEWEKAINHYLTTGEKLKA